MEVELLKETNKLIENAKNIEPLQKWVGKKYWYVRPNGIVEECTVAAVHLFIRNKKVDITVEGERGEYYNNSSFLSEADAKDLAKRVAGTYIHQLEAEEAYLETELQKVKAAKLTAILPTDKDLEDALDHHKRMQELEEKEKVEEEKVEEEKAEETPAPKKRGRPKLKTKEDVKSDKPCKIKTAKTESLNS